MAVGDFNRRRAYWWVAFENPPAVKANGLKALAGAQGADDEPLAFRFGFNAVDGASDPDRTSPQAYAINPGTAVHASATPTSFSTIVTASTVSNGSATNLTAAKWNELYDAFLAPHLPDSA